jgi:hypothetical protein
MTLRTPEQSTRLANDAERYGTGAAVVAFTLATAALWRSSS